jgi:ABC-type multidrug transport system fused ATPase/permease subunit
MEGASSTPCFLRAIVFPNGFSCFQEEAWESGGMNADGPRTGWRSGRSSEHRSPVITTLRSLSRLFELNQVRWYLLIVLVVATSAMEALSAVLVFSLLSLLVTDGLTIPIIGHVTAHDRAIGLVFAGVAGFFILRAGIAVLRDAVFYRFCYGAGARLEAALLYGYLTLPPREIRRRGLAELVRNVHDTVIAVVEGCLIPSVLAAGNVLTTIGIVAVMLVTAPWQSLIAIGVFGPLLWLMARMVRRPVRRLGERVEEALAGSLRTATETLHLAGEIQMAGRAADFGARFGEIRRRLAKAGGDEEVIKNLPRLAAETVLVLFVIGFIWVATTGGHGDAALPTLGLFAYAALRLLPSLIGLVGLVHSVAHSGPAVETVLADEPLMRRAGPTPARPRPRTLALRGVTVTVPETGRTVLRDVDLTLHRGDVVAVVGPNGGGKSTLIDVLAGVLTPVAGTVIADDRPISDAGGGWATQVAMVSQHVHLLDADIPTNVTLDVSGRSSAGPRLAGLITDVGLQPVIERLRGRTVGEDGRALSGGERQRVALARALDRSPGVLLIDEGTSALDSAGRGALRELIEENRQERITVLVTHDPEFARSCTYTVHVEGGTVRVERPLRTPAPAMHDAQPAGAPLPGLSSAP